MPRPDDESCGNCRFWEEVKSLNDKLAASGKKPDVGECRRYPLTVIDRGVDIKSFEAGQKWGNAQFPRIRNYGWCGEWQSVVTDKTIEEIRSWVGNETPVAD